PHMHLRGKDARFVAFYPDGTSEQLLYVPNWDFNWQTDYSFKTPKRLPAGTRLEYTANFDNSANNKANPDPTVTVHPGQRTTDEMMIGFITYAAADPKPLTIEEVIQKNLALTNGEVEAE
ncbi:redoxin, partial [Candidatus Sumerlaeota bacterium]|nr:redoxin [Candidatus Sumerlaeota bacterium]